MALAGAQNLLHVMLRTVALGETREQAHGNLCDARFLCVLPIVSRTALLGIEKKLAGAPSVRVKPLDCHLGW